MFIITPFPKYCILISSTHHSKCVSNKCYYYSIFIFIVTFEISVPPPSLQHSIRIMGPPPLIYSMVTCLHLLCESSPILFYFNSIPLCLIFECILCCLFCVCTFLSSCLHFYSLTTLVTLSCIDTDSYFTYISSPCKL